MQSFIEPLLAYLVAAAGVALLTLVIDACLRIQKTWGYDGTLRSIPMLISIAMLWPLAVVVALWLSYLIIQGALLQRRRSAVRLNPPHCSGTLVFSAVTHRVGVGRFSMRAEHVEILGSLRLPKLYSLDREVEELMLYWLDSRDPRDTAAVHVLEVFSPNFEALLHELCRMGAASMECPLCSASYTVVDVTFSSRGDKFGRNYTCILCPEGHALLQLPVRRPIMRDVQASRIGAGRT